MSEESFSLEELAQCARRELAYRKRVYPRLVMQGKMDKVTASLEIAKMAAIWRHFETKNQPELHFNG